MPQETLHRQVKYLNNVIEADHGKLKQLIRPDRPPSRLFPQNCNRARQSV